MPAQSYVRPRMTVALLGSSLTTGYLSADWVPTLNKQARTFPEAKGPIFLLNLGKGGRTSLDGLAQAPLITSLRPTHILTEGYAINDCFDSGGGPLVSPATHIADIQGFVGQWQASIPGVDITLQTMSSVSTYQTGRAALSSYYADELTTAAGLGIGVINNFASWPNPLDGTLTHGAVPFSITPTSGYVGMPGATTLDPVYSGPNMTLSADDLTFVEGATFESALATAPITQKSHWENLIVTNQVEVGVASRAQSLTTILSLGSNAVGMRQNGTVFYSGTSLGSAGFTFAAGDIVGVEVDPVAQKIYFMKGATRSAGFDTSPIGATLYPAVGAISTGSSLTAKFTIFGDGLHPIWAGAVDTYTYPNIVAWLRTKMAAFWP